MTPYISIGLTSATEQQSVIQGRTIITPYISIGLTSATECHTRKDNHNTLYINWFDICNSVIQGKAITTPYISTGHLTGCYTLITLMFIINGGLQGF